MHLTNTLTGKDETIFLYQIPYVEDKCHSFLSVYCVQWFTTVCRFICIIIQYIWNNSFATVQMQQIKMARTGAGIWHSIVTACNTPCLHLMLSTWVQAQATLPLTQLHERHPGRYQMMSQVRGSLSPTCETWVEFQVPGISLTQPWLSQAFSKWISSCKISFCITLYLSNKMKMNK